jgi:hypothetical protein
VNAIKEYLPPTPASVYTLKRRWLGSTPYWFFQIMGWGLVLAVQMASYVMEPVKDTSWPLEIAFLFLFGATGILITHLLRIVYLRCRNKKYGWKKIFLSSVLWSMYAGVGMAGAIFAIVLLGDPDGVQKNEIKSCYGYPEFINFSIGCWLSFMCWSGFYFGALTFRQYQASTLKLAQMDAALKEAKLRVLRAQVNPHFLFNSLNTVRAMIPHNLAAPRDAVTTLADFLRASLTSGDKVVVPFSEELEVIGNYLAMEKLRLEERLNVDMDIDPSAKSWPIPPFLLQTLVENAVKYGVAHNESGGPIHIRAGIVEGALSIVIVNSGRLDEKQASTGLGLRNSRDRLELLYGPEGRLSVTQTETGTVTTKLVVPYYKPPENPARNS